MLNENDDERQSTDELGQRLTSTADLLFENTARMVRRLRNKSEWAANMAEEFDQHAELMREIAATLQMVAIEVAHMGADALNSDRVPGPEFDDEDPASGEEEGEDEDA